MNENHTPQPRPVEAEISKLRAGIDENILKSPTVPKPSLSKRRVPSWLSVVTIGCVLVVILAGFLISFGGEAFSTAGLGYIVPHLNSHEDSQVDTTAQGNPMSHALPTMQPLLAPEPTPWPTPPIADSP
ncbi:MAG: hypothetical protein R3D55_16010 [Chloroflexota bacterium]